jgi:hypothetical protein
MMFDIGALPAHRLPIRSRSAICASRAYQLSPDFAPLGGVTDPAGGFLAGPSGALIASGAQIEDNTRNLVLLGGIMETEKKSNVSRLVHFLTTGIWSIPARELPAM